MWENMGCPQIRAVDPLPLLYANAMFIASFDRKARLSPTVPRNDTVQSVPAAWCLQHEKNKGKSRERGRERHDAQHSAMRKHTRKCLCLHTFAK